VCKDVCIVYRMGLSCEKRATLANEEKRSAVLFLGLVVGRGDVVANQMRQMVSGKNVSAAS
jgi:hypothetical protein